MRSDGTSARANEITTAAGGRLDDLPLAGQPAHESPVVLTGRRFVALLAIATMAGYLAWRITSTLAGADLWIAIPFLALELHLFVSFCLYVFTLWDTDSAPRAAVVHETDLRVAVLIPTYDESIEVLLPTVAAAVELKPDHETWVLDDGNRPEIAAMAAAIGAQYLSRVDNSHAKAGNLNNALEVIEADVIGVLDADHVPLPNFLTHTLGYFIDPKVALVQTPQDYYNTDSFTHTAGGSTHEEVLFHRMITPGRQRWGAAFWLGTNALLRTEALRSVGGVATETVTEDIHTTIRMHAKGWRTIQHNEVLARGLAPSSYAEFATQRERWGLGSMQVLRVDNPMFVRGLTMPQRLAYMFGFSGWFDCWRTLGFLLIPPAVLLTGALPLVANTWTFLAIFGVAYAFQQAGYRLLARGTARYGTGTIFDLLRMPSNLRSSLRIFSPGETRFAVTPKGRTGKDRNTSRAPRLLVGLAALLGFAWLWSVMTFADLTPITYVSADLALITLGWLLLTLAFLVLAINRVQDPKFASERRDAVRFDARVSASFDDILCELSDISLGGARVTLPTGHVPRVGERAVITIDLDEPIRLVAEIRNVTPQSTTSLTSVGIMFYADQQVGQARLTRSLIQRQAQLVPRDAASEADRLVSV